MARNLNVCSFKIELCCRHSSLSEKQTPCGLWNTVQKCKSPTFNIQAENLLEQKPFEDVELDQEDYNHNKDSRTRRLKKVERRLKGRLLLNHSLTYLIPIIQDIALKQF